MHKRRVTIGSHVTSNPVRVEDGPKEDDKSISTDDCESQRRNNVLLEPLLENHLVGMTHQP